MTLGISLVPETRRLKPPKLEIPRWAKEATTNFRVPGITAGGRVPVKHPDGWTGWLEEDAEPRRFAGLPEAVRCIAAQVHPREERMLILVGEYCSEQVWEVDLEGGDARVVSEDVGSDARYVEDHIVTSRRGATRLLRSDTLKRVHELSGGARAMVGPLLGRILVVGGFRRDRSAILLDGEKLVDAGALESGLCDGFTGFKSAFELDGHAYIRTPKKKKGFPSLWEICLEEREPTPVTAPEPSPTPHLDAWVERDREPASVGAFRELVGRELPRWVADALPDSPEGTIFTPPYEALLAAEDAFGLVRQHGRVALEQLFGSLWYLEDDASTGDCFAVCLPSNHRRDAPVVRWSHEEGFGGVAAIDLPTFRWVEETLRNRRDVQDRLRAVEGRYGDGFVVLDERLDSPFGRFRDPLTRATTDLSATTARARWIIDALLGGPLKPGPEHRFMRFELEKVGLADDLPRALYWLWRTALLDEPERGEVAELLEASPSKLVRDARRASLRN